jgi:hypothetical protein
MILMKRATKKPTTAKAPKAKAAQKAGKAEAARKFAIREIPQRLDDIAGRLDVAAIAIFGIEEISGGDPALPPLMTLVQEIGHQVSAIAKEIVKDKALAL